MRNNKVEIDYDSLYNLKKTFNREYTKGFIFHEDNENFINPKRPNHQGVEIGQVLKIDKNRVFVKLSDDLSINDGIRFVGKEDSGMIVTKMEINNRKVTEAHNNDIVTLFVDEKIDNKSLVVKTTDYHLNKEIENIIKQKTRKVLVNANLILKQGKPIVLEVEDENNIVTLQKGTVAEAIKAPMLYDDIYSKINRTGDTIFQFAKINIDMDDNIFVPISELNEIRREALDKLYTERMKNKRVYVKDKYNREVVEYKETKEKSIYLFDTSLYNKKMEKYDRIYYDADSEFSTGIKKLPRVIEKYKDYNEHLLVGELGSVNKYDDIDTDFSLNVVNSYSVALLNSLGVKRVTLSYELTDDQTKELINAYIKRYGKRPNLSIIVYAKEEMMISKFNLINYFGLKDKAYLQDRFNNLYSIYAKNNLMYIVNHKPRILEPEKFFQMGINEVRYNIVDKKDLDYI